MAEHLANRIRAWAHWPAVQDAALAAALLLVFVQVSQPDVTLSELVARADSEPVSPEELWWAATGLAVAGVALRRRWPVPALGACAVAAVLRLALAMPLTIIDLSVPILLYTVAVRCARAVSLAALAGMVLLAVAASVFAVTQTGSTVGRGSIEGRPPIPRLPPFPGGESAPGPIELGVRPASPAPSWGISWEDLPGLTLALVASWAIGSGTRSRRAYLEELRARAVDLEREQGQQAVLAVAAERGRISRELHDVVAHGLSVMVIQAQGGAAALDNRPADTRVALDAIVKTGRDSLADMRRVLGTVGEIDDAWHPQPGLARLPALLAQVREAGTPVRLRFDGAPGALPSAVDLTVYRIVQEALTNTMKHAGPVAVAEVVIAYAGSAVHVEVSDNGLSAPRDDNRGRGLRGMRERVKLLGGSLDAGPGPGGGFRVRVALPVEVRRT
ncbi:MAG TPA: histidine kinase [Pilimelia sp.]|nr:histidine kinase [Pilimelia sp.]